MLHIQRERLCTARTLDLRGARTDKRTAPRNTQGTQSSTYVRATFSGGIIYPRTPDRDMITSANDLRHSRISQ